MIEQRNTILLSDLSVDPALLNADCGNGFRSRQMANFWFLYDMGFWYSFIGNYMTRSCRFPILEEERSFITSHQ